MFYGWIVEKRIRQAFDDSQEVARALAIQAEAGLEEAVAEPILS